MDEKKKMINWVAGISTLIVALLIVIVVMEPKNDGVSRAAASRAAALALASKSEILEEGPETSYFPAEIQDEWYVKYMDYLYEKGYLDPEQCPATEESALSPVTYGELSLWTQKVSGEQEERKEKRPKEMWRRRSSGSFLTDSAPWRTRMGM